MARKPVYSTEQVVAALTVKKGLVFLAAKHLGCHPDTIYHRAKTTKAIADCIRWQRGEVVDTAEMKLFEAIEDGKPWAILSTLKTLGKDRGYVERHEHADVTEPVDEVSEVVVTTREQAKASLELMADQNG